MPLPRNTLIEHPEGIEFPNAPGDPLRATMTVESLACQADKAVDDFERWLRQWQEDVGRRTSQARA